MSRPMSTIALSGLFLWLSAKVLVLPGTEQFNALGLCIAASVIALIVSLANRTGIGRDGDWLTPLGASVWVWLSAMMATTAVSISPARSVNMIILSVAYSSILIATFHLVEMGWVTRPMLLRALWFGSVWYVFAIGVLLINFYATGGTGPFRPPSANMIAGMMNLLLLTTLTEFKSLQRWSLMVLGIALVVILVTASRGGLLGLSAGLIVLIIRERAALAPLAVKVRQYWPVAGSIAGVVAVAGLWQLNLPTRPFTSHMEFWSLAWQVFLAHPIAGSGPGTFQLWWVAAHPEAIPYTHALSLVLNTAAEQGIIGLVALAVLAVCTLRAAWPHPGLFAALVAFGFQNLVDGTHPEPAIMVTLAVLIGSTLATKEVTHENYQHIS